MEIKNEEKFSDFSKSIEQLDKQDLNLSNDIDLVYKELSKIEDSIQSFDVSEQIKELKLDIENIQLQKGEKGDKGEAGKDGANGKDGKDGRDGIDGIDGLDGKDGENGSPDTAEDIVKKINTLESVIERKTIKGLDNLVDQPNLDRAIEILDKRTQYLINKTVFTSPATTWASITGTQSDVNVGGFTNDVGYLTSTDLSGYVPTTRTLTINGVTEDLSADRTWSVGTVTSVAALTLGTSGTDLSSSVATGTTTPVITLNVPTASALNRGALSSTDWSTFNSKESALTFSTGLTRSTNTITANLSTGIAGGQSVIGGTASGNNLTLSSTSHATKGKLLFGTSAYDEVNNRLGIGTTAPDYPLDVRAPTAYGARVRGTLGGGLIFGEFSSYEGAIWDAAIAPTTLNYMFLCSGGYSLFNATAGMHFRILNSVKMTLLSNGNFGIGLSPTAVLTLKAGTATANTAPLKFTSGTNLTTAEVGAVEMASSSLFFTRSGTLRASILMGDHETPYNVYSQASKGATSFTTGANNVLLGFEAGKALNSGTGNILLGYQTGNAFTTGNYNTLLGYQAGTTSTGISDINAIGYRAGYGATGTSASSFLGQNAGSSAVNSYGSVFIGQNAGSGANTVNYSNFIGWDAGKNSTSPFGNFIGFKAGESATGSGNASFIGVYAGSGATSSDNSVFIGTSAGQSSTTSSYGIFIGSGAGTSAVGSGDSFFAGQNAGRNSRSTESIFVGKNSGYNAVSTGVTGDYNIGLGTDTGKALTTGTYNILLGYQAGDTITTGSNNVIIGQSLDAQSNTTSNQLSIQNAIFGTGNNGTGTTASTGKIGIYTVAPTCALDVTGGIATSRTAVTSPAATDGNIFSGTYTPTLTGVTNVTSTTAYVCQYMRVGNVVTVSGKIEVTPTVNNAQTTIGVSLPIASNFANSQECGGAAHSVANTVLGHGAAIYADATNDRAEMDYFETHGASDTFSFSFTYQII